MKQYAGSLAQIGPKKGHVYVSAPPPQKILKRKQKDYGTIQLPGDRVKARK